MGFLKKLGTRYLLWFFRTCARLQLAKIKPLVIGVGGAAGKTSVVAALHAALAGTYRVRSGGGANSETGIPFGILRITMRSYGVGDWLRAAVLAKWRVLTDWQKYDVQLVEFGIDGPDEPKNMTYMLKIVTPRIALTTNIALEHSEYFEKVAAGVAVGTDVLDRIAAEEEKLLLSVPQGGTAVVNLDDPRLASLVLQLAATPLTVSSKNPAAIFFGRTVTIALDRFAMEIVYRGASYHLNLAFPLSRAYVHTVLLAVAGAVAAQVSIEDAIRGIESQWQLPAGRLSVFAGVNGLTVIDSSYNATPIAMLDALSFLEEAGATTLTPPSGQKRRVAILGDMRELGAAGSQAHTDLAGPIHAAADHAILIGPQLTQFTAPALRQLGTSFETFPTFAAARDAIRAAAVPNSVILVKGSQNTLYLERAVELLLADPANDAAKLCRRGARWDRLRAATP